MSYYNNDSDMLKHYLRQIQNFEPLSFEEEQELARKWRDEKDYEAADKLMQSYLRLVVKVALGFKGYGLPVSEVIQEGNIGLMQAILRFDPDRGFRLSTYAMWWIRAAIQEYVLTNWSLVKIGTTAAQKKLFFNLRRMKNKLREISEEDLSPEAIKIISKELGVKPEEVRSMEQRMISSDQSLNSTINSEVGSEWMDWLVEERPDQEEIYGEKELLIQRRKVLQEALENLDEREREILVCRRLRDSSEQPTLEQLSQHFGISRERVRQLEMRAFSKIKKFMRSESQAA